MKRHVSLFAQAAPGNPTGVLNGRRIGALRGAVFAVAVIFSGGGHSVAQVALRDEGAGLTADGPALTGAVPREKPLPRAAPGSPIEAILDKILKQEYLSARSLLSPLLRLDDADALHITAVLDENGWGGPRDLENAISLYARAAAKGQVDSQFALGELAFGRRGVKRDLPRAAEWFSLAANQGHPGAKARLGQIYTRGLGVEPDVVRGVRYLEEAASAGDRDGQFDLGVAYLEGLGKPQDYQEAARWFLAAAKQLHPDAQFNLALLHDSPLLGPPDPRQTVYWLSAAANAGLPRAYVALGLLVSEGRGIDQSDRVAADWFERAALAGDQEGQFLYAVVLAEGRGRARQPSEALRWLDKSMAQTPLDPAQADQRAALRARLIKAGAKPSSDRTGDQAAAPSAKPLRP
ncbi:MAG: tetratricopeptide repeat protein [Pseudomonadota bacterium]